MCDLLCISCSWKIFHWISQVYWACCLSCTSWCMFEALGQWCLHWSLLWMFVTSSKPCQSYFALHFDVKSIKLRPPWIWWKNKNCLEKSGYLRTEQRASPIIYQHQYYFPATSLFGSDWLALMVTCTHLSLSLALPVPYNNPRSKCWPRQIGM